MASYLKPRRGTYSTAVNQLSTAATCLKNGEIFFELNSSGAGKGMGKIKMGDGSTSYSSLPYFLSLTDNGITFTATESTNQLSSFSSGVTIPNAFRYIRSTLSYLVTQVTNLNNDLKAKNLIKEVTVVTTQSCYTTGYNKASSFQPIAAYNGDYTSKPNTTYQIVFDNTYGYQIFTIETPNAGSSSATSGGIISADITRARRINIILLNSSVISI